MDQAAENKLKKTSPILGLTPVFALIIFYIILIALEEKTRLPNIRYIIAAGILFMLVLTHLITPHIMKLKRIFFISGIVTFFVFFVSGCDFMSYLNMPGTGLCNCIGIKTFDIPHSYMSDLSNQGQTINYCIGIKTKTTSPFQLN